MLAPLRRLHNRFRPLKRSEYSSASERSVENLDALTAARQDQPFGGETSEGASNFPPGYVKAYDEGRPRK